MSTQWKWMSPADGVWEGYRPSRMGEVLAEAVIWMRRADRESGRPVWFWEVFVFGERVGAGDDWSLNRAKLNVERLALEAENRAREAGSP